MTMTTERYMNQFLSTITPLITVPTLSYIYTDRDLMRLRNHAKVCDDIANTLRLTSARVKSLINAGASPIFRLPNEILSEIMLWACDIAELTSFKPLKYERFTKPLSPLVLGQVCQQWRKVSQGDPRLWTFLWVDLTFQTNDRDVKRVEHWFRMAKELPLTVNITQSDDTRLMDEMHSEKLLPDWQPCRRVLKSLFSYSHRIRSLFFGILDGGWGDLLKTPMNFSNLRHLTINNEFDPAFSPVELLIFSDTPQLQSVDLWAVDPSTLRLPLGKLTRLRISWAKLDDLTTILPLCPNLTSLLIRNIEGSSGSEDEAHSYRKPICLPKLHTLEVAGEATSQNLLSLLRLLRCPSLAHFKYNTSGPRTYSSTLLPLLLPFLERTALVSLDASGILFEQRDDLKHLLHTVPGLHYLALDLGADGDTQGNAATDIIKLFHRHTGRCDILPKLRHLELAVNLKLSFDALFTTFETRRPKTLSLSMAHGSYHWRSPLGDCRENGNKYGLGLDRLNIRASAGHVSPAEWKSWFDSLSRRGLPVRSNAHSAKTPMVPALKAHPFNLVNVI